MRKIAAVDRTVPAVAQIDLSDVRSRQSAGVLWSARGWGVGRVGSRGQRKQLLRLVAGSRINFNRRDPLAGFTKPVFARWNGSGLIGSECHTTSFYGRTPPVARNLHKQHVLDAKLPFGSMI